jgi:hypothetical protein
MRFEAVNAVKVSVVPTVLCTILSCTFRKISSPQYSGLRRLLTLKMEAIRSSLLL